MKVSMIAMTLAACLAGSVAHATVLPAPAETANASQIAPTEQPHGSAFAVSVAQKTRAQVRQELVQAEHNGQLAKLNRSLYSGG